ncbi:MAG: cysteine hydrolase [Flavobacterium sp.]|nr:MAG: cysteine hydrolase [Flavobacterium sp.]
MKALLIIDMQIGNFTPYERCYDTLGLIDRINALSDYFRTNNDKVIIIQHDGSKENCYLPQTEEWELLPELTKSVDDIVVSKTANDSFYNTELALIIEQNNINELIITGSATDFCVDATVKSALTKDYQVTVIADAHTASDRPFISAETVINHYNWLWADFTPTKFKINVITSEDFIKQN